MSDFLKIVVVMPAVIAGLASAVYLVSRGWEHATWLAWGLHFAISVFVWFPLWLAPYLRKQRSQK